MYVGWMIRLAAVLLALFVAVSAVRLLGPTSPPRPAAMAALSGAAAQGPVKTGVVPASAVVATPAAEAVNKSTAIVTPNTVFFGCAVGTALGAAAVAVPPVAAWAFTAGALPSVVAVALTSATGCGVGLFGGVVVSTLDWVATKVGSAWGAVFG